MASLTVFAVLENSTVIPGFSAGLGFEAAAEVFQEFALQLVHGNLRGANPERGRFRNFVKGTRELAAE